MKTFDSNAPLFLKNNNQKHKIPSHILETVSQFIPLHFKHISFCNGVINEEPSALGCARGNLITLSPDAPDIDTPAGVHLVAHELTHVSQFQRGMLDQSSDLIDRQTLELEAELVAVLSVESWINKSEIGPALSARHECNRHAHTAPVMFLLPWETFKNESSASGRRNRVKKVDDALKAYHEEMRKPDWNAAVALTLIRAVKNTCTNYMRERTGSERIAGVKRLHDQASVEEQVVLRLAEANGIGHADKKWALIAAAQETKERFETTAIMAGGLGTLDTLVKSTLNNMKVAAVDTGIPQGIINSDLDQLRRLARQMTSSPILKTVVEKCLRYTAVADYGAGLSNSAGCKLNVNKVGNTPKYTINHNADQGGGTRIRLGSLLHELTHMIISETFGNTALLLDCSADASDTEILMLSARRRSAITELKDSIAGDNTLGGYGRLKSELEFKVKYPLGSIKKYVPNFIAASKLSQAEHDKWVKLENDGIGLELIEYTPVINQMLFWCFAYGLPRQHATFQRLEALAKIELTRQAWGRNIFN